MSVLLIDAIVRQGANQSANERTTSGTGKCRGQDASSDKRTNAWDWQSLPTRLGGQCHHRPRHRPSPLSRLRTCIICQGTIVAIATDEGMTSEDAKADPLESCHGDS